MENNRMISIQTRKSKNENLYANIRCNNFNYVIMPTPNSDDLEIYKDFILKNNINTLVKLCKEITYNPNEFKKSGINVIDLSMEDGSVPSIAETNEWIKIIKKEKKISGGIASHCMSGLGRSPLFICVGLIKIEKIDPIDAISMIRTHVIGALNNKQLNFLLTLKNKKICSIL